MADAQRTPLHRHLDRLAGIQGPQVPDDVWLLEQFLLSRDADAFTALVQRHGPLVWRVCRRVLADVHDAEDAFQATFLVLARKAGAIRKPGSLASWLHGTAFRIARKARAHIRRQQLHQNQVPVTPTTDPSLGAACRELGEIVEEEVQRLPEKYRVAILLCYWEGKSVGEVARQLGWPPGTVKTRLARARHLLHDRLARRGVTLSAGVAALLLTPPGAEAAVPAVLAATASRMGMASAAQVSARVVKLAEASARGLGVVKVGVMLALVLGVAAAAGMLAHQLLVAKQPQARQVTGTRPASTEPEQPKVRTDRHGDPLPPEAVARLGTMRFRHEGEAQSLVFSPDGKVLAARSQDGVFLWNARTGRLLRRLPMPGGMMDIGTLISFSPDSKKLAGPLDAKHIGLWEADTGKLVRRYALPEVVAEPREGADIHTVRFSPDGKYLAVGGCNNSYVLDVAAGKPIHHFKECVGSLVFSPDSANLVLGVTGRLPSQGCRLQVRDVRTGKLLRQQEGHPTLIIDIAFSPDGKTMATGGSNLITLWDVTGKVRTRIKRQMGQVKNLAFTPDGKTLVSGNEQYGKVHVWDVATGKERRQLPARLGILRSMALSPDGKTVAAGTVYNTIRLWDLASGRELFAEQRGHDSQVNSVAFAPDGKLLASGGENGQVWLWETATGKPLRELRGTSVRQVAFSPDGRRLALLSPGVYYSGKFIDVHDVATGKKCFQLPPGDAFAGAGTRGVRHRQVSTLAFSPGGKTLVSADWKQPQGTRREVICGLNVWEASTGRRLRRFEFPGFRPECLAFHPGGKAVALAGCSEEGTIRLWDLGQGKEVLSLRGHPNLAMSVAISPEGRRLVSGGHDRTVRLWEVATGKEILVWKGHRREITAVAFSPDGRLVASSGASRGDSARTLGPACIRLWDPATGKEVQRLQGHHSLVTSLAFAPDGSRLASGLRNSTVLLWEVSRLERNLRRQGLRLSPKELEAFCSDLAGEDARKAHTAIWTLAAAPNRALPLLKRLVRPAPGPDPARLRRLIADLDSNRFAVRQSAFRELESLGAEAAATLRQALAGKPTLETRKRLEELLARTNVLHAGEVLRGVRAVEVLERIATPEARQLLTTLTKGAPQARLTQEAKASLARLER
jgi:RNA polymerase sigma factor (sigma-70 family)